HQRDARATPHAARDECMREPIDRRVQLAPRQAAHAVVAVLDERFFVRMRGGMKHHGEVWSELGLAGGFRELRERRWSHRRDDLARAQYTGEEHRALGALDDTFGALAEPG